MKRVLFLTNIPSPYRVDFFNELGKYVQLEVVYELASATDRDKKWQEEKANSFMEVILQGIRINADSAICLGILRKIAKNKYDVIIVGGYSTPTAILAILYMWIFRIPFVLNADGGIVKQERKIKYLIKRFLISRAQWWLSTGSATNEYLIH